jgi:hypothetical protein
MARREGGLPGKAEDEVQAHGAERIDQAKDQDVPGIGALKDPGKDEEP